MGCRLDNHYPVSVAYIWYTEEHRAEQLRALVDLCAQLADVLDAGKRGNSGRLRLYGQWVEETLAQGWDTEELVQLSRSVPHPGVELNGKALDMGAGPWTPWHGEVGSLHSRAVDVATNLRAVAGVWPPGSDGDVRDLQPPPARGLVGRLKAVASRRFRRA